MLIDQTELSWIIMLILCLVPPLLLIQVIAVRTNSVKLCIAVTGWIIKLLSIQSDLGPAILYVFGSILRCGFVIAADLIDFLDYWDYLSIE